MRIPIILLSLLMVNISCNGQKNEKCTDKEILTKIKKLPQTIKDSIQLSKEKKSIIYQTSTDTIESNIYKVFKQAANDEFHISTLNLYYADNNCDLFLYDTVEDKLIPINKKESQIQNKKDMKTAPQNIEFSDLFNEGTIIKFSPNDLNDGTEEIKAFKAKLQSFENESPLTEDFDIGNLSYLINNETFFDAQYYADNSWLQYFITKYKINVQRLNKLMHLAIQQEDLTAVKVLISNNYIISEKELAMASETKKDSEEKTRENRQDGYESYLQSKSKINEISTLLNKYFAENKIQDPDGYTNLRKDKDKSSEIIEKIKSGSHIQVLDNSGDWFLVKTKEGKQGYVHKSRVKSGS